MCLANGHVTPASLHCRLREQIHPERAPMARQAVQLPHFLSQNAIHLGPQDIFIGNCSAV